MKKLSLQINNFKLHTQFTQIPTRHNSLSGRQETRNQSCQIFRLQNPPVIQFKQSSVNKKVKLYVQNEFDRNDEYSKVDILQDTYLQQTRTILELLRNDSKQRNKIINIHKLNTKKPIKPMEEKTKIEMNIDNLKTNDNEINNNFGSKELKIQNTKPKIAKNREIEDIFKCTNWRFNIKSSSQSNKLINNHIKQSTNQIHITKLTQNKLSTVNIRQKSQKIKSTLTGDMNPNKINKKLIYKQNECNSKIGKQNLKLTINIKDTVQNKYNKK